MNGRNVRSLIFPERVSLSESDDLLWNQKERLPKRDRDGCIRMSISGRRVIQFQYHTAKAIGLMSEDCVSQDGARSASFHFGWTSFSNDVPVSDEWLSPDA